MSAISVSESLIILKSHQIALEFYWLRDLSGTLESIEKVGDALQPLRRTKGHLNET